MPLQGYFIFVSTYPIFPFHKKVCHDWAFGRGPEKYKMPYTITKMRSPNFKSWNGSLLISVERLLGSNVGFDYGPFCLSGGTSATIWYLLSASVLTLWKGNNSLIEPLLPKQHCPHKHESDRGACLYMYCIWLILWHLDLKYNPIK